MVYLIDAKYYLGICVDAQQNYARYKKEAEESVVRTEFVEEKRYDLAPFWFERNTLHRGKLTDKDTGIHYGFDEDHKLRVTACDDLIDGYGYTCYESDHVITRLYVRGKIDSIKIFYGKLGRFERCVEFIVRHGLELKNSWYDLEEYIYEHDRLMQVRNPKYTGEELYKHIANTYLVYDEHGELYHVFDGMQRLLYNHLNLQGISALREVLKREVINESAILFKSTAQKINGEQLCFFVLYLDDDPLDCLVDPLYEPGLERVRVKQIEENHNQFSLWSGGEHPTRFKTYIENQELLKKLRALYVHWSLEGDGWNCLHKRQEFWQEVAYSLNEVDWSEYFPVTDDFVVFVDWDGIEIDNDEQLKAIPVHRQVKLREIGSLL
ncbi:hypothetical protein [Paenibacillus monticola]|uniref:Uncharacterized protein n=1 Tax=Paenibacillus monticola TaxID=2666075 RepID=A0A7X2HBY4_9BACL|nr:hypothetical protein [Paenibacillus monticola]MRN57269.1 hypothetical protein [Paenibacillus monticola]